MRARAPRRHAAIWVGVVWVLGVAACGRYGPPTRQAPFRAPQPVADTRSASDAEPSPGVTGQEGAAAYDDRAPIESDDPRGDADRTDPATTTDPTP